MLDGKTSTFDDKTAVIAFPKECPAKEAAIGAATDKTRSPDGKWACPSCRALVLLASRFAALAAGVPAFRLQIPTSQETENHVRRKPVRRRGPQDR